MEHKKEREEELLPETPALPQPDCVLDSSENDRKRCLEELSESEELFRRLSEASFDGMIIHENGRILSANQALADTFGYRLSELIGRHVSEFVVPESWHLIELNIHKGYDKPYEIVGTRKDGSVFFAEALARNCRHRGRKVRVGAVRDISECRKANAELVKTKKAAEAANRAKSQFLANVSHEMRTPMNGILGFASALEKTTLSGNQREAVEMILLSGSHLLNIIDDLLDLAKIEAGKLNLVEEPVALDHFLEEICDFFKPLAAAKNLTLTSERTGDSVAAVMMDPARVRQMLVNLIGNALKFTQRGSVRIRADLRREQNLEDNRRSITFEVADTGIGITSERLETIFDSFNQAPDAISQTNGGTGLGLAITRRLVRMLGGEIHVESAPGKGTTFRLDWITEVNRGAPKGKHQAPATSLAVPELKGKTILAVDDNPINLKLVVYFLESTKARILTAEDGREALALMREYLPDLVLMDMRMPFMDGYEATRQAKSDPATASIPIVAVTASAMREDRDRILETGCDEYLAKPITREDLFETIVRFLLPARADKPAASETSDRKAASSDIGNEWLSQIAQAVVQEYAPQLMDLLDKNDLPGLRRFGHTMKGLGRQFQLASLAQWGEAFENSAETLGPDALRQQAARFDAIAREIMALCGGDMGERVNTGETAASLDKVSNYS